MKAADVETLFLVATFGLVLNLMVLPPTGRLNPQDVVVGGTVEDAAMVVVALEDWGVTCRDALPVLGRGSGTGAG